MPSNTVLASVDFSSVTPSVVATAARLARAHGARLLIQHVVPVPPATVAFGLAQADSGPLLADLERDAEGRLCTLARSVAEVPVETTCTVGLAGPDICRRARETAAEYIVLGSHGHGALYELLIGSTTQGVLRDAPCPVLVVPARGTR